MGCITWSGQGDLASMVMETKVSDSVGVHRMDEVSAAVV